MTTGGRQQARVGAFTCWPAAIEGAKMTKRKAQLQKRDQPNATAAEERNAAKYPSAPFASAQEHHGLRPPVDPDETNFDPEFPGKRSPTKQWWYDADFLYRTVEDLPAFLAALKSMMPFYRKHSRLGLYRLMLQRFTYEVRERAEQLRQDYNDKHNANIPPCPNDFYMIQPWQADAEREIRRKKTNAEARDGHDWSPIGMSKKNIAIGLGIADDPKIAGALNALCESTGILLRPKNPDGPKHQKTWFVALDTLPQIYRNKFTAYLRDSFGVRL